VFVQSDHCVGKARVGSYGRVASRCVLEGEMVRQLNLRDWERRGMDTRFLKLSILLVAITLSCGSANAEQVSGTGDAPHKAYTWRARPVPSDVLSGLGEQGAERGVEEGEGAEGGGGEVESESKQVKVAVAVMLLGSITFQMSMFYLVNYPDEDIQRYSYQVIGMTISIFSAVLLFQGFNGVIEAHLIERYPKQELLIDMIHMLWWFILMQLVTAVFSGALPILGAAAKFEHDIHGLRKYRHLNLMCFAKMLAHMTGFAAINAFTTLQETAFFASSSPSSLLILPLAFSSLVIVFRGTDFVRERISNADGVIDEHEQLWDQETEESENDVVGLCLSFTTVQSVRYFVAGHLPDKEGDLPDSLVPPRLEMHGLLLVAIGWAFASLFFSMWLRKKPWRNHKTAAKARYARICQNWLMMCFAWSLLFAADATVQATGYFPSSSGILAKVVVALSVSLASFAVIFVLDRVADSQASATGGREGAVDASIDQIIASKALLIGFTWESAFDTAVDKISKTPGMSSNGFLGPATMKLLLSLLLCLIVIPAFRMYILPTVHAHEKEEEFEEEEQENMDEYRREGYKPLPLHFYQPVPLHLQLVSGKLVNSIPAHPLSYAR